MRVTHFQGHFCRLIPYFQIGIFFRQTYSGNCLFNRRHLLQHVKAVLSLISSLLFIEIGFTTFTDLGRAETKEMKI